MGLTSDEKKLMDDLTAKANQPDAEDEFEIEVYDTQAGKGARIPFSKGSRWLFDTFGIGDAPAPAEGGEAGEGDGAGATEGGKGGAGTGTGGQHGYFGRK